MSRSYKKTSYCGDKKGKDKKRCANHKVRSYLKQHPEELLKGRSFRKIFPTWDICDYYWICSWEEYWASTIRLWKRFDEPLGEPFPDQKEEYRRWYKFYKMK